MIRKAAIVGGLAGALVIGAVVPSLAQYVIVSPGNPYVYQGGPAGGYAYGPGGYVPVPRHRHWNDPAGYDTGGMPFSYGELGWQPGPPTGAPYNPCTFGQRSQNRC